MKPFITILCFAVSIWIVSLAGCIRNDPNVHEVEGVVVLVTNPKERVVYWDGQAWRAPKRFLNHCKPKAKLVHDASGKLISCKTEFVECTPFDVLLSSGLATIWHQYTGKYVKLLANDRPWHRTIVIAGPEDDPCAKGEG